MKLQCPKCGRPIEGAAVNVAADLAQCAACNEVFTASELVAGQAPSQSLEPPTGSKIGFRREGDSEGVFDIPRRSLGGEALSLLGFSVMWLGGIAFWTWSGRHGGTGFMAFSIPFWLIGLGMLGAGINRIAERQSVEIGADTFTVRKRRPFFARCIVVPYSQVSSIAVKAARTHRSEGGTPMEILAVTVAYGTKTLRFAEGVSEAEMNWLAEILKAVVHRKVGKRL